MNWRESCSLLIDQMLLIELVPVNVVLLLYFFKKIEKKVSSFGFTEQFHYTLQTLPLQVIYISQPFVASYPPIYIFFSNMKEYSVI